MKKHISHSLEETSQIAMKWLTQGRPALKEATIVGLSGHLGSGKTAFTKAVAEHLGITEHITSPTFVIMKLYAIKDPKVKVPWKKLIHIDAYRLERGRELEALGFESLVADSSNLILIEWPENVKEVLVGLGNYSEITFSMLGGDGVLNINSMTRIITEE